MCVVAAAAATAAGGKSIGVLVSNVKRKVGEEGWRKREARSYRAETDNIVVQQQQQQDNGVKVCGAATLRACTGDDV